MSPFGTIRNNVHVFRMSAIMTRVTKKPALAIKQRPA
jgi:hypothetical protein